MREQHSYRSGKADGADDVVWLLVHIGQHVPKSPCVGTKEKILSCKTHDLSGLLTKCKVNLLVLFFFSTTPISPHPTLSSHILSCVPFTPHHVLSLVSFLIPHIPLHPSAFPPSVEFLHVISFYLVPLSPSCSTSSHPPLPSRPLPLSPSLSASLAGCSLQWVSIMEAGSGAAAAVGSAALGLLGATATSSHDILDR